MCLCYVPDFLFYISAVLLRQKDTNHTHLVKIKELDLVLFTFPIFSMLLLILLQHYCPVKQ